MDRNAAALLLMLLLAPLSSCGGGGSSAGTARDTIVTASEIRVVGSPGSDGVFDPAPMSDASGNLWMSHSMVRPSPNDPNLFQVRTRIAASPDGGSTWSDTGVDPNNLADADFQVPPGSGSWVTWRFEVSRLLFDPYDADASRRWKILWHRVAAADIGGRQTPLFQNSWIGLSTATAPNGSWSAERKLFTGSMYNSTDMNPIIGAPEFPLATLYPGSGQLANCTVFTEPGMLARSDGIYVSLQCTGAGKIVLLRCDRAFSACTYLGDLLSGSEAAQFSLSGQALNGFAATELVESGGNTYLIVTGYEPPPDTYRGCLVFRVGDLATAAVERSGGNPVLVKRIAGTSGSFNGACGYDPRATGSGIIYSESTTSAPHFHLFASHIALP
jgi:hypothetical protein